MPPDYASLVERLSAAVLCGAGVTPARLRQAIAARAAELGGYPTGPPGRLEGASELPPDLQGYVDKVARQADQVTDDDIAALRQAGYSEDAIFEITLSAAWGAGLGRLERGRTAMQGGV